MMEWILSGGWFPSGFALRDPFHHFTPTGMSYLYILLVSFSIDMDMTGHIANVNSYLLVSI